MMVSFPLYSSEHQGSRSEMRQRTEILSGIDSSLFSFPRDLSSPTPVSTPSPPHPQLPFTVLLKAISSQPLAAAC